MIEFSQEPNHLSFIIPYGPPLISAIHVGTTIYLQAPIKLPGLEAYLLRKKFGRPPLADAPNSALAVAPLSLSPPSPQSVLASPALFGPSASSSRRWLFHQLQSSVTKSGRRFILEDRGQLWKQLRLMTEARKPVSLELEQEQVHRLVLKMRRDATGRYIGHKPGYRFSVRGAAYSLRLWFLTLPLLL